MREPVERQLADAKERHAGLAGRWAEEKDALDRIGEITNRIDELRMEAERAERAGDLQRVAEIRYGELPALEKELEERRDAGDAPMVKEEVDEDDIAAVVGALDRDSRLAPARGRDREADPHGGAAAPARDRPARGGRGGLERAAARALRAAGSRTGRSARSSSSARPASARPSSPVRSPSSCSTTSGRWSGSTCPSTRSGTRSRGSSARRPATSATTRAASSPRRCAGGRTRSSCSTRSRRRTPRSSTCCCRCSTTGGSPTARAARSTSATRC